MSDGTVSRGGYSEPGSSTPGAAPTTHDDDRYEGAIQIGSGGMGVVEVVIDRRLEREVARKRPRADSRPTGSEHLRHEAAIAASLEHPGIVPVYDSGVDEAGPWYTMRLVRGRTLDETLRPTPSLHERLLLLRRLLTACEAVAYGHRRGVIHRDLKPANVMLGEEGETLVVDWGLACRVDKASAPSSATSASPTGSSQGAAIGTPAYMSPEQAGAFGTPSADARSDVWALGAMLFELVAGRRLRDPVDRADARTPPELGPLEAAPAELRAIIGRALAWEPADRYGSAGDLARDLDGYLQGRLVDAYAYRRVDHLARFVRAFRLPIAITLAALVSLAAVGAAAYRGVVNERERAVEAERLARGALAESASQNALLLSAMATREGEAGRRTEAEALAKRALAQGPSVEAHGVLAAFALDPSPTPTPLPRGCPGELASPSGRLRLCFAGRRATLSDAGEVRWSRPVGPTTSGFVTDDHALLIRLDSDHAAEIVDLEGRTTWRGTLDVHGVAATHGTGALVHVHGGVRWQRSATEATVAAPCGSDAPVASALGTRAAFACADGGLRVLDADGRYREVARGLAITSLAWLGDDLVFGTRHGELVVVAVSGVERQRVVLNGDRVLALRADGDWVAAQVEAEGLWLWRLPLSVPLRLATTARRMVHLSAGRLETEGTDTRVVWQLPEGLGARLDAGGGVSAIDAQGGLIALGRGDGCIRVIDTMSARATTRCGEPRTLKAVLFDEAEIIAHRTGARSIEVFDAGLVPRAEIDVPGYYRRLARLEPGTWVGVSFGLGRHRIGRSGLVDTLPAGASNHVDLDARAGVAVTLTDDGRLTRIDGARVEVHAAPPGAVAVALGADARVYIATPDVVSSGSRQSTPSESVVTSMRASDDGAWVAVGHRDGLVRIFDAELTEVARFRGHTQRVAAVAWDGDGLVSGSWDGTVRRWSVALLPRASRRAVDPPALGIDLGRPQQPAAIP